MGKPYAIKSSEDLYDATPASWMFKPYYVAIRDKEQFAKAVLGRELEKHYMDQDGGVTNTEYKAMNFNSSLRSEMDVVISNMGIEKAEEMWDKMSEACLTILSEYSDKS